MGDHFTFEWIMGGNVSIWHDMIKALGEDANPVVVGSSVHNQCGASQPGSQQPQNLNQGE